MDDNDDTNYKKLSLILNYRRFYILGFSINHYNGTLVIVDYVKQSVFYSDDIKPVLLIPYGEYLVKALKIILRQSDLDSQ